jgi:8-oxo-dGTP pyrophosphatase MutT (NUDIX family)
MMGRAPQVLAGECQPQGDTSLTDNVGFMQIVVPDLPNAERPAVPAATLVLVRDGIVGIEVLMIRRSSKTAFGGMWAFPGGVIEDDDVPVGTAPDPMPAARRAAVRESMEEVGLAIDEQSLIYLSHWLPPEAAPRRFSTWFFVAPSHDDHGDVGIDGHEIHDHRWVAPREALAMRDRAEIEIAPPTFVTLDHLGRFDRVDTAMASIAEIRPTSFATEISRTSAGTGVCLWAGDASYRTGTGDETGRRHRLVMHPDLPWQYINDGR